MEVNQKVEVTCPHCGKVFSAPVTVEVEPQEMDWRD